MISKTGDWTLFRDKLKSCTHINQKAKDKLQEDSKLVVEKIEGHIDRQDLSWTPLSDSTTSQKGSNEIYIETGALRNSFNVSKVKESSKELTYHVGVPSNKVHTESGLTYNQLLEYMEFGTMTQPARPLIQPTNREIQKELKQDWVNFLKEEIGGR